MIQRVADKAREAAMLLRMGEGRFALRQIGRWAYSDRCSVGFRRDLSISVKTPEPRGPVTVRVLNSTEISTLLALEPRMSGVEIHERLERVAFSRAHIATCYGAITANGVPCCMQWVIRP